MKKYLLPIVMFAFGNNSFSQSTTSSAPAVKTDYLKKSKNQKRVATIFLAGGAASVLTALLIPKGKLTSSCSTCFIYDQYYKNDNVKGTFGGIGILSMLGSIPIYLASHRNKKKSMRLSFKTETVPQLQNGSFTAHSVPSLTLKISL